MLTVTSPPLKGAGGMFNFKSFSCMLTIASPPILMLVYADLRISPVLMLVYADRHISPFEGSPRAGAAEYVHRGDV